MSRKELKLWLIAGLVMVVGLAIGSQCTPAQPNQQQLTCCCVTTNGGLCCRAAFSCGEYLTGCNCR